MTKIKDIDVQSRPDGILLEPFTDQVLIFSHASPSITAIDPKDGTVTGTIDIPDGGMEEARSDGQGKLYCCLLYTSHEHKVQAWFNGHDHDLQHLVAGNLNLFCSGAGSQVRPTKDTVHTKFAQSRSGFTTVSLQPDRMLVRMTDNHGQLLYSTTVPAGAVAG